MRWLVAVLLLPILAGCVSDGSDDGQRGRMGVDRSLAPDDQEGAIAGIVVDDRFRPVIGATVIARPDDWVATTDDSGQFSFVDLRRDTYRLVVGADGHEAAPMDVTVQPGQWTDATVIARRVAGEGALPGRIVTEYALWNGCTFSGVVFSFNCGILFDDDQRIQNVQDYTHLDDVEELVIELRFNRAGRHDISIAEVQGCDDDGWSCDHSEWLHNEIFESRYAKLVLPHEEERTADRFQDSGNWTNHGAVKVQYWPVGALTDDPTFEVLPVPFFGIGLAAGHHVDIAQTVFIGDHGVDVDTYCILCGP